MKNQYRGVGGLPKKEKLGQFVNLRTGLARKREWYFCGGLIPQCTLRSNTLTNDFTIATSIGLS